MRNNLSLNEFAAKVGLRQIRTEGEGVLAKTLPSEREYAASLSAVEKAWLEAARVGGPSADEYWSDIVKNSDSVLRQLRFIPEDKATNSETIISINIPASWTMSQVSEFFKWLAR